MNYNSAPMMRKSAILLAAALLVPACALFPTDHNGAGAPRQAAVLPLKSDKPLVALALGSGGARGFAHVGVIKALQEFVNRMVGERPIERLAKPFAVVATEAKSGRMTVFNRGDTGLAVRASASVPNLFVPPIINGEEYVDGGLSSPVPVKLARAMGADIAESNDE